MVRYNYIVTEDTLLCMLPLRVIFIMILVLLTGGEAGDFR